MSEVMEIRMPAVYGDHPIVGKLSSLNGEAKLQDCVVHFRYPFNRSTI